MNNPTCESCGEDLIDSQDGFEYCPVCEDFTSEVLSGMELEDLEVLSVCQQYGL